MRQYVWDKEEDETGKEFLYRYEDRRCSAGVDEFDNPYPGYHLEFSCRKFEIIKRTPKGAWIRMFMEKPKFILLTAHKRYACPTKLEAIQSCRARKNRYNSILQAKISYNEDVLRRCADEERRLKDDDTKREAVEDPSQESKDAL
jgi:hypothetical protein